MPIANHIIEEAEQGRSLGGGGRGDGEDEVGGDGGDGDVGGHGGDGALLTGLAVGDEGSPQNVGGQHEGAGLEPATTTDESRARPVDKNHELEQAVNFTTDQIRFILSLGMDIGEWHA